jgi:hypothetical protein
MLVPPLISRRFDTVESSREIWLVNASYPKHSVTKILGLHRPLSNCELLTGLVLAESPP